LTGGLRVDSIDLRKCDDSASLAWIIVRPDCSDDDALLEVRASRIHGRGVFAGRPITEGVRIIEYTGEVISDEEADSRYDDRAMERHETYLFSVADGKCIDGAVGGNEAHLINHSCDPNCEAVEIDGHIWIEAVRPIAAGEELTYDYAYERTEGDEARADFYGCRCGARRCRGTILAPRDKSSAGLSGPRGDQPP
jgi:SET domain-containing protein